MVSSPNFLFEEPSSNSRIQEQGSEFRPRFDTNGLITCITIHSVSKEVLMVAYMDRESLGKTIETSEAWYWSRSRQELWHKGATSGQVQKVVSLKVDCDQDALLMEVLVQGDGRCCHTGQRTCFYRSVIITDDNALSLKTK